MSGAEGEEKALQKQSTDGAGHEVARPGRVKAPARSGPQQPSGSDGAAEAAAIPREVPADDAMLAEVAAAKASRVAVLAIAMVAGFAELAYAVMNVSAMPVYLRDSMRYGTGLVATIGAAFLLCEGLAKGPFGILGDRIGRKTLMVVGPLISVFTSLLTLLVHRHQWYGFVVLRMLDGFGAAALWPSAMAMIADVVPEEKRTKAMSLFNVTYMVGIALGPFLGGLANDLTRTFTTHVRAIVIKHGGHFINQHIHIHDVDPRSASFYLISVLFLITAAVAYWRVPNVRPRHETHSHEGGEKVTLRGLLVTLREMPAMMIMALTTFFGIGLIMMIIKLFAMDEYHVSETQFGALLLIPSIIIAAVSLPLGSIGDRIGRVQAMRIGIGICTLAFWTMLFIQNEWALVIGGTLIGVGFVMAFPAWMAHISSTCDPAQRGSVMGAFGTAQGVGAMLGAPIGGYMYQHVTMHVPGLPWLNGHYSPFVLCAILLLASWLIATLFVPVERRTT